MLLSISLGVFGMSCRFLHVCIRVRLAGVVSCCEGTLATVGGDAFPGEFCFILQPPLKKFSHDGELVRFDTPIHLQYQTDFGPSLCYLLGYI